MLQPLESLTVPLWVVRCVRVTRFCTLSVEKDLRNMSLNMTARAHSLQKRVNVSDTADAQAEKRVLHGQWSRVAMVKLQAKG